ncbi:unnamed protein product [Ranitomeya imitator]|uniref:Polyprotein n=1 Tax=Ranitomeya imitator TaxID=111125 RepID=A0ABN9LSD1_9NEOB|nr:unnamed protein product [Ranitomeya imitator]
MKWAFEEWRHWLEGAKHRMVVLMDHKNLTYLESAKRLNPRQARWSLFFSRFDFVVSYLPGSKNVKADALSRSFVPDSPGVPEPAGILKEGHVVCLHGIPENIVSDRGSQFVSRFWRSFCAKMGIDLSFSSAFHAQTNGQTERTNQTLETYLRCFVSADQDDWVSFLPLAEFALNNRASSATLVSPFFCNSGFHPRFSSGQVEPSDCPGVDTVVDRLQQIWTHVVDNLTLSQEKAQRFANHQGCVGPRLRVGHLVWLSSRYVPMKVSSPKFKPRFIGPYKISEVLNPVSFRLALPASFAIHNVFHRSLLRRYVAPMVPFVDPPAPVLVEEELEYVVEKILDSRISRRKLQYLVKWKGYGQEDNSWVFASDVHTADLVRAFHLARPDQPGGSGDGSEAGIDRNTHDLCVDLLNLVLRQNFFLFEDDFFVETCGTAMGSNVAPAKANLYMDRFEREYVYTNPIFQQNALIWYRYIDDIFCIWQGNHTSLQEFYDAINTTRPELTFTLTYHDSEVTFLDTKVLKNSLGNLNTDLYSKPMIVIAICSTTVVTLNPRKIVFQGPNSREYQELSLILI